MNTLLLALAFFALAFVFSMLGLGGGVVYVPLLVLMGLTVKEASVISLFAIALASSTAFATYLRSGRFDWKLAAVIDPPTDVMAFIGGFYANLIDEELLIAVLVALVWAAGVLMLRRPLKRSSTAPASWFTWRREFRGEVYFVNVPLTCTLTGLIGFFVGMVGITGGIFKVPIMVLACGVPMDVAVGTSSGMVLLTALSALIGHLATASYVDWSVVASVGLACLLGGAAGARVALKTERAVLRRLYGALMFALAVALVAKQLA